MAIRLRRGKGESSPLWIFEYPIEGDRYYIGADAARGKEEGDFSAAVCWNGYTGEQAFSFAAKRGVEDFASTLNLLGRLYFNAMMYPEQTGGDGAQVLKFLRDHWRYPTWAPWRGRDDKLKVKPSNTIGWETTWKTRQKLLSVFRINISNGFLKIRDPRIVSQMGNAQRDESFVRWEVTRGHDDLFIAAMIGAMAVDQWPPPKRQNRTGNLLKRSEDDQGSLPFETEPSMRLRERHAEMMSYQLPRTEDSLAGI